MNKKFIISGIIVAAIALIVIFLVTNDDRKDENSEKIEDANQVAVEIPVKEFTMTSFVEMVDGKPYPQYSLKEMTVNKGDLVRIKITVTAGMHDFKIDEYNIYADTKLDEEMVVEFVADQAGEFVYYCTKPGHRQNGHWGTLKVLDN